MSVLREVSVGTVFARYHFSSPLIHEKNSRVRLGVPGHFHPQDFPVNSSRQITQRVSQYPVNATCTFLEIRDNDRYEVHRVAFCPSEIIDELWFQTSVR